jgi:hypothetical protein
MTEDLYIDSLIEMLSMTVSKIECRWIFSIGGRPPDVVWIEW